MGKYATGAMLGFPPAFAEALCAAHGTDRETARIKHASKRDMTGELL
jgi:hypothetical protein